MADPEFPVDFIDLLQTINVRLVHLEGISCTIHATRRTILAAAATA
jgi:hypothetical protein